MVVATSPWNELKRSGATGAGWLRWGPGRIDHRVEARGQSMPQPLQAEELDELRRLHRSWGADADSMESIEALGRPGVRVVVTGQQPALLAGPLLVLYKAAAAVRLAAELQTRHHGLHFVPVFWVADEDHDFDEVRRACWPGISGLEENRLPSDLWVPGRMVGLIETETIAEELIRQIEHTTHPSEFRDAAMEMVREAYGHPGQRLGVGFAICCCGFSVALGWWWSHR